jgi:conjugative relaxase-like TrwC/TraI family protein
MNSRIGIDLTFSAPKSVSIQALVGGDPSIVRAHDLAVARALAATEDLAAARKKVNGRSRVERTRNLVVAKFRHETSRERDPQLHTHAVVLNLTQRSDGEWRALRNDEIIKTTRYLGAVYRAELAAELQRAGYALHHEREGFFELAHIDRHQLAAFSRRAEQIEKRLAESGLTLDSASSEEKQKVKLETRPRKTRTDREALFREWRERAREVGIDFTKGRDASHPGRSEVPVAVNAAGAAHVVEEGARRAVRYAIHHLTERQAIMNERELLDIALKHAVGRATLPDIARAVDRQTATGYLIRESPLYRPVDEPTESPKTRGAWIAVLVEKGLVREDARERVDEAITKGGLIEAERRYTTQTALEREKRILQIEREGRAQVTAIAVREDV